MRFPMTSALVALFTRLLDAADKDMSPCCASRLQGESLAGVEDRHSRRLESRRLRASLCWR